MNLRCIAIIGMLVTTLPSHAALMSFNWTGSGGYSFEGTFSFNELAALGPVVDETELDSFEVTAFSPSNIALRTYDLTNQFYFNFNFEISTNTILTSGNAFSDTGILIGELSQSSPAWLFGSFVGCGSTWPQNTNNLTLFRIDGNCDGQLLDIDARQDQTILASLVGDVTEPSPIWIMFLGLILICLRKRLISLHENTKFGFQPK